MRRARPRHVMLMVMFGIGAGGLFCAPVAGQTAAGQQPPTGRDSGILPVPVALQRAREKIDAAENGGPNATAAAKEAVTYISMALAQDPLNVTAGYLQGRLAFMAGRPRDALPRIQSYVADAAGRNDWKAHKLLGDIYIVSYPEHALSAYDRAVQLAPNESDAVIGLARANLELNRADEAIDRAEQAIRLDKEERSPSYRMVLARALLLRGDRTEDAVKAAREAVDLAEAKARATPGDKALVLNVKGAYALLLECLQTLSALYPERTDLTVQASLTVQDMADVNRLLACYDSLNMIESALQTAKDDPGLLYEKARLNRLIGRDEEAVKVLKTLLEAHPDDAKARELLEAIAPQRADEAGAPAGNESASAVQP